MIMRTEVWSTVRELGLTVTAYNLLNLIIEIQEPGGKIRESQSELAAQLEIHPNLCSRAMKLLTDTNVVLRPARTRYELHPLVAAYSTEEDMHVAIREALDAIARGELPRVQTKPEVPKRHLAAVS